MMTFTTRTKSKSGYGFIGCVLFIAFGVFLFTYSCHEAAKCAQSSIDSRVKSQAPAWVARQAEIIRQKDSPSYRQPEEQVTLRYLGGDGVTNISAPLPLHKICTAKKLEQAQLGDKEVITIHINPTQSYRWSLNYRSLADLKAQVESSKEMVQTGITIGILLLALAINLAIRRRRKIKAQASREQEEEQCQDSPPKTVRKGVTVLICIALFAFTSLWIGVFSVWLIPDIMRTYPSANYPAVEGKVLDMRGHTSSSSSTGGRHGGNSFHIDHTAVQFMWKGKEYITREQGMGFGKEEYNRAQQTKRCTVYVNEQNPEQSLLVKGVAPILLILCGVFFIIAWLPAIVACVIIYQNLYRGKPLTYTTHRR